MKWPVSVLFTADNMAIPLRWLLLKGRRKDIRKMVESVAGSQISKNLIFEIKDSKQPDISNESLLDVFKSCIMFPILVVNYINWAVVTVCYYGLTMNSVNLSGDIFLNSLLGVLIEAPGK